MGNSSFIFGDLDEDNNFVFKDVYDKYSRLVYYVALAYLKDEDDAEDMTQKIFCRLWEKRKIVSIQKSLSLYLKEITKNECVNKIKHDSVVMKHEKNFIELNNEINYTVDGINSKVEKIKKAIDNLPSKCRDVFILSCVLS